MRAKHVEWITGARSPNRTDRNGRVYGTDLGIVAENGRGEVLAIFGDTFGPG